MKKLVLVCAVALPVVAFAKGSVKPGQWHIHVTHEMVGAPFTPPPTDLDECITPQQADDPKQMVQKNNKDCDPVDIKSEGNKVTFKITCHKNGSTQTGSGEMVYAGESYTGSITVEMDHPRMGHVKMVNHMSGKRTGDCTK